MGLGQPQKRSINVGDVVRTRLPRFRDELFDRLTNRRSPSYGVFRRSRQALIAAGWTITDGGALV